MNQRILSLLFVAAVGVASAYSQGELEPITPAEEWSDLPSSPAGLRIAQAPRLPTTTEKVAPATQQQTMPTLQLTKQARWEYKVVENNGPLQDHQLNERGADGWELVAVTDANNQFVFFFKRPKQ
jgi:hypothetical protein